MGCCWQARTAATDGSDGRRRRRTVALVAGGWLLAVLALANPVWDQAPLPVFQSRTARVIVLDLSRSMAGADLKPDRLARARFKVEDVLLLAGEGQIGLVVFAGDAFTVTPLTRDAATLRSQLRALEPGIMPVQGSRADLGLRQAGELLRQAGLTHGQILLIADGVEGQQAATEAAALKRDGYSVAVLGVGTAAGAPLTDAGGHTLHDAQGKIVVPVLEQDALRAVADAGGGPYASIGPGDRDVATLLAAGDGAKRAGTVQEAATPAQWNARGPWLVPALLPLAALAFRRGWMFSLGFVAVTLVPTPPAMAASADGVWANLWQTREQQAAQALAQGDFDRASDLAGDPLRRGAAQYKQGDYTRALADFAQAPGAEASYNRGNALAKLGRYEDAVAAYGDALQSQPEMADAVANKAAVEALLERQRKQKTQPQSKRQQDGQPGQQDQQDRPGQKDRKDQAGPSGPDGSEAKADPASEKTGAKGSQPQPAATPPADAQGKKPEQTQTPGAAGAGTRNGSPDPSAPGEDPAHNQFGDALKELEQREKTDAAASAADGQGQTGPGTDAATGGGGREAEALNSEERLAAEQWLRRIPDDPGGLLRRKFLYQYQQRQGTAGSGSRQGW